MNSARPASGHRPFARFHHLRSKYQRARESLNVAQIPASAGREGHVRRVGKEITLGRRQAQRLVSPPELHRLDDYDDEIAHAGDIPRWRCRKVQRVRLKIDGLAIQARPAVDHRDVPGRGDKIAEALCASPGRQFVNIEERTHHEIRHIGTPSSQKRPARVPHCRNQPGHRRLVGARIGKVGSVVQLYLEYICAAHRDRLRVHLKVSLHSGRPRAYRSEARHRTGASNSMLGPGATAHVSRRISASPSAGRAAPRSRPRLRSRSRLRPRPGASQQGPNQATPAECARHSSRG